ncbi:ABC transporter substrate-binding protein [Pseudonocardia acidicola]|uniref:ABC transporter substrate-binding protein n=1 Tax=Pseudonocardia acidicola TaxID=2724939 RepID=A0ABX1SKB0_9PSEU|nr:ABC transporter substrate-binding protein [Pseudonocardia acidicola]NMI01992.1 ABC transporter substrate-binding protein [Pseudonocardia acidicola]
MSTPTAPAASPARRRPRLGAALLCALLTTLAACSSAGPAPSGVAVPDGELRIAFQFAPRSGYALDTDDAFVLSQIGSAETLVVAGPDGTAEPALAASWARVDPLTWRFELRPGVRFHDGSAVDAAAVVTALRWVTGVAAPPRALKGTGLIMAADGAAAVRITTAKPDPILPLRLTSPNTAILAPAAYTGSGPPQVLGTGTGPMRLTATDGTQSVTLERNDAYWGGRPALAKVIGTFVPDPSARALSFRAGDVDIAQGLPEPAVLELSGTPGVDVQTVPAPRTVSLFMNQSAAPFSDIRVRQAVQKAIDRTALAEQALAGAAVAASELFGPAVPWGSAEPPAPPDVAAARALLAQSGYGPDNPLSVRLWTYPNRPELPVLATAVQAMLKAAGIDTQIRVADYSTQEAEVLGGRYDLFILSRSYLTDVPDAAGVLSSDYTCAGSYNLDRYCSPQFDGIVAGLPGASDTAARQKIFRAAAARLVADATGVPLVHSQENAAARNVIGFRADPDGKRLVTAQLAKTG